MTPHQWSISGLAIELARDRRTIARAVARIDPVGRGLFGDLYYLRDVTRSLYPTRLDYDAESEQAYEDGAVRFAEALLAPDDATRDRLPSLAAELARCRAPAKVETILARWVADACWSAILASILPPDQIPSRPDWSKVALPQLRKAIDAMTFEGARCEDVLELLEADGGTEADGAA